MRENIRSFYLSIGVAVPHEIGVWCEKYERYEVHSSVGSIMWHGLKPVVNNETVPAHAS